MKEDRDDMAVYAVVNVRVTDPDRYSEYRDNAPDAIARYGGKYLARGGTVEVLEGDWNPQHLVVLEFESMQRFRAWYDSPEYAPLKQLRSEASVTEFVVVEGLQDRRARSMRIEAKLEELGLVLPEPMQVPSGLQLPFSWVRVRGNRAYISGHIPLNEDGSIAHPLGKVGAEVSAEEGYQAARRVALAHLGSLKRALVDLDRITAWLRVFAMVNVAPDFNQTPLVTNGYSDLILELYGPEVGAHARSSIGMMIPLNAPVNCEAEVEIDG